MPRNLIVCFALFCLAAAASAAPLTQCPPRSIANGVYTGCNFLITLNADGSFATTFDPSQPFIGGEDSYAAFQNNSSGPISSITLDGGTVPIFELDRDGPGSTASSAQFCPSSGSGLTGYEGPGVTFSNVNATCTMGQLNFTPALQAGASAFFFLEEAISPPTILNSTVGPLPIPPTVPECGTSVLAASGLLLLLWKRSREG